LSSSLCFWSLPHSAIRCTRRRARMHRYYIGLPPLQSKGRRNREGRQFISRNSPAKMEAVSKSWLTGAHPCTSSSMRMSTGRRGHRGPDASPRSLLAKVHCIPGRIDPPEGSILPRNEPESGEYRFKAAARPGRGPCRRASGRRAPHWRRPPGASRPGSAAPCRLARGRGVRAGLRACRHTSLRSSSS